MDFLTLRDELPFAKVGETMLLSTFIEPLLEVLQLALEAFLILVIIAVVKRLLEYLKVREHIEDAIDGLQDRYDDIMSRVTGMSTPRSSGWESRLGTPRRKYSRAPQSNVTAELSESIRDSAVSNEEWSTHLRRDTEGSRVLERGGSRVLDRGGSRVLDRGGSRLFRKTSTRVDPIEVEMLQQASSSTVSRGMATEPTRHQPFPSQLAAFSVVLAR